MLSGISNIGINPNSIISLSTNARGRKNGGHTIRSDHTWNIWCYIWEIIPYPHQPWGDKNIDGNTMETKINNLLAHRRGNVPNFLW